MVPGMLSPFCHWQLQSSHGHTISQDQCTTFMPWTAKIHSVTSHKCKGVSKHWQVDILFSNMLKATKIQLKNIRWIQQWLEYFSQKANIVEGISMSCRCHARKSPIKKQKLKNLFIYNNTNHRMQQFDIQTWSSLGRICKMWTTEFEVVQSFRCWCRILFERNMKERQRDRMHIWYFYNFCKLYGKSQSRRQRYVWCLIFWGTFY